MEMIDVEERPSEQERRCERSKPGSEPRSMADVSLLSCEHGINEISVSGKDCNGSYSTRQNEWRGSADAGKVVDQLAEEIEEEIAYHESRYKALMEKLKELRKLSGELKKERTEK